MQCNSELLTRYSAVLSITFEVDCYFGKAPAREQYEKRNSLSIVLFRIKLLQKEFLVTNFGK